MGWELVPDDGEPQAAPERGWVLVPEDAPTEAPQPQQAQDPNRYGADPAERLLTGLMPLAKGVTAGFADEAVAGEKALINQLQRFQQAKGWVDTISNLNPVGLPKMLFGETSQLSADYERNLAEQDAKDQAFAADNPIIATANQVAGALAPPTVGYKAVAGLASPVARFAGRTALNAGYGALYGAGEGRGLEQTLENAQTGAGMGAAVGLPFEALRPVGGLFKQMSQGAKEEAFGIRAALKTKQATKGLFRTADDQLVPIGEYSSLAEKGAIRTNPLVESLDRAIEAGGLTANNPKVLDAQLTARQSQVGEELGNLIGTTEDLLTEVSNKLGIRRPKFKPDWSFAEKFIEKGADTGSNRPALRRALANYKSEWQRKPQSFADLVAEKSTITKSSSWAAPAEEQARAALGRAVYRGYQKAAERAFEDIVSAAGRKDLSGQFKKLNQTLSAYHDVSLPLAQKAANYRNPILEAVVPKSDWAKAREYGFGGLLTMLTGNPIMLAAVPAARSIIATPKAFPQTASRLNANIGDVTSAVASLEGKGVRALAQTFPFRSNETPIENTPMTSADNSRVFTGNAETLASTEEMAINTAARGSNAKSAIADITGGSFWKNESPQNVKQKSQKNNVSTMAHENNISIPAQTVSQNELNINVPPNSQANTSMDKLVKAMISVESAGNRKAVSNKGALGLMQIMPAMAKAYGVSDPFDAEQNVQAGVAILQDELDRFGSIDLALAAYNAGSPAVMRAIKRAGSTDFEQVAKYLPKETRAYVPKVLSRVA